MITQKLRSISMSHFDSIIAPSRHPRWCSSM